MVGVVKQQQCRGREACRFIDDGAGGAITGGKIDVDLAVLVQGRIKERSGQAVRSGDVLGVCTDGQLRNFLAFGVQLRGEGIRARGAQPGLRPGIKIAVRVLLERLQEVIKGGGGEGVLLEVVARTGVEIIAADVMHQLLENRRSFGIGDAIEVLARGIHVRDLRLDGVRGGQLILQVGPVLAGAGKVCPGLGVVGAVDGRIRAHKFREGLLEPQVIPPLRSDQITEPHMGHLVQDGVCTAGVLRAGSAGAEDVVLRKRHQAGIFHRAEVVFGYKDGIVLAPRIGIAKVLVEKVHALGGNF